MPSSQWTKTTLCQFATMTRYWTPTPPVNVNGVKPAARVTPFELTVVHIPLNCLPLRSTDITVIVAVGFAIVDVVVEVDVVVVVVVIGVVVVVVVINGVPIVKTMFVFPSRVKVVVPPPPFAIVLPKVPMFAPTM